MPSRARAGRSLAVVAILLLFGITALAILRAVFYALLGVLLIGSSDEMQIVTQVVLSACVAVVCLFLIRRLSNVVDPPRSSTPS